MPIKINHINQFNKEYKDFIIVVSKFSELKNIKNLPFNVNFLNQNRQLEKTLNDGAEKAKEISTPMIKKIRNAVGIKAFN